MSEGLLDWFSKRLSEGIAEITSQVSGVFKSDESDSSKSGHIEKKKHIDRQEMGRANYEQGENWERYTEGKIDYFGLRANWHPPESKLVYNETFEEYGRGTQIDITIEDLNDYEIAIIECKALGNSKWNDIDQAKRLVHVAKEREIILIFSTADGTDDCFSSKVKEVLNETQCFIISPDNLFFADPANIKETGITLGIPPELRDHWNWFGTGSQPESSDTSDENSADVNEYDNCYESESRDSYDSERNNSNNIGVSLFDGFFGSESDSEVSDISNSSSDNSDEGNGGSWFDSWFGNSSDSGESDGYDSSSSDSDSYDSGVSDSYDYSSSSGDSDSGSWFGDSSSDSGGSDSYSSDYSSSDSGDSSSSDSSSSSGDS